MGCALLSSPSSSENSDPQKSERPWEYATHMVAVIKCGHLWRKKVQISIVKMNSMGTCFPIGTEKIWLHKSHSFGMFLIKKKPLSFCSKFPAHTALARKSRRAL